MDATPVAPTGWPFLVARGRRKGYRVLLVPAPLAESNQSWLLAEALGPPPAAARSVRVESVAASGTGPICCAYRTERWGEEDRAGGPGPLDEHGRPLEILYGVVCATPDTLDPDSADLEVARSAAHATYHRFLTDEAGFLPERSQAFDLQSRLFPGPDSRRASAGPPVLVALGSQPQPEPASAAMSPQPADGKRLWVLVALSAMVVALGVAAWALLLRSSDGTVVRVRVEATTTSVECDRSDLVRFDAVVTSTGQARVTFHWEEPSGGWRSGSQVVAFDSAGSRTVYTSRPVLATTGETLRGELSLVVDEPAPTTDTAAYALTCRQP